jgi:hypothetical protein
VLRGEFVPVPASTQAGPRVTTPAATSSPEPPIIEDTVAEDLDPGDDADEARLQSVKNLLDATEIDDEEFARLQGDAARS